MRGGDAPAEGLFADPAVRDQADMFATPVGVRQAADGTFELEMKTDREIEADLAAEDKMVERLRTCLL